jgi:hypothetical protein
MNEDGCSETGRSFQEREQFGSIEIPRAAMSADLKPWKSEFVDASLHLLDGQVGILKGHRAEADETIRVVLDHFCDVIIEET